MATIAPSLPKPKAQSPGGSGDGFDQGGSGGDGGHGDGRPPRSVSDQRYYTGMMLGLAAILMLFAAFTSAYVVRKGLSNDWQATAFPGILWLNSMVLLASSFTLEKARRWRQVQARFQGWWWATTGLGMIFLMGQILAWQELVAGGVYLNTNPSSSFFYLLTGAHAVHLLGGVIALLYLSWRVWRRNSGGLGATALGVTALYWHFMDGLWIYLFLLLLIGR
jgi:cytochrome c oxidase subunit 3